MKLICTATAGTMESNDIMVTLQPKEEGGIQIDLTSNVLRQFGRQIENVTGCRRFPRRFAPRNDKSGAFAVLTIACSFRQHCAGPGCPRPYDP